MKAPDEEKLAFKALDDPNLKFRWRAANALAVLSPLSDEIVDRLFSRMHAEPPEDKDLAARHYRRVTQIIQTVGGMKSFKDRDRVEAAVLEVAQKAAGHKKGILQRIRKSGDPDEAKVLSAAAAKALDPLQTRSTAAQPQG